jgi:hypothetical protein
MVIYDPYMNHNFLEFLSQLHYFGLYMAHKVAK